ncbi:MAG TPA: BamA/TamA family outer membrane protein [Thermoanaerobaculia bacterium]|nr:BamA/TamA family outer membrane protein [Thermoanaerobaculia bacterium]
MKSEPIHKDQPRRGRRWLRPAAGCVFALVLLPVLLRLALELPPVRSAILGAVAERVREATTLELSVDDWQLGLLQRRLRVEGLALRDQTGRDVLMVPRIEVVVADVSALLAGRVLLERLDVVEPRLDLAAWPEMPETTPESEDAVVFEVRRLAILGASVDGAPLPPDAAGWIGTWRASGLDVEGSLRAGALALAIEGEIELEGERIVRQELSAAVEELSGALAGPWRISGLTVRGEGIEVDLPSAELGLEEGDPWHVAGRVAADLGRIVPELSSGTAWLEGELDLRRWRGRVQLAASELPGELLEPWLGRDVFERLGAAGSKLDASAELDLAQDDRGLVRGSADLQWSGTDAPLLVATLRLTDGGVDAAGVLDWESLEGELQARADRLPAEVLRPFLGAELFSQLELAGAIANLEAEVVANARTLVDAAEAGGLGSLRASLRGDLEQRGEHWLMLRAASASPPAGAGPEAIAAELVLDLLPELPGERRVTGTVWSASRATLAQPTLESVVAQVTAPDVAQLRNALEARVPALLDLLPDALDPELLRGSAEVSAELDGPLRAPSLTASIDWLPSPDSSVSLRARGRAVTPLAGEAELRWANVDLAPFAAIFATETVAAGDQAGVTPAEPTTIAGLVSGEATFVGSLDQPRGTVRLRATGLAMAGGATPESRSIDEIVLEARGDLQRVDVDRLEVRAPEGELAASGWFVPRLPLDAGSAELELRAPDSGLERFGLGARLEEGVLRLQSRELLTRAGAGELEAVVPLVALRSWPDLPDAVLRALPELEPGTTSPLVELRARVPELSRAGLDELVGAGETLETLVGFSLEDLFLEARFDPARLGAAGARMTLGQLTLDVRGPDAGGTSSEAPETHTIRLSQPLLVTLREGELRAGPVALEVDDHALLVDAEAQLDTAWMAGDPMGELVRHLRAEATGTVPVAIAEPFLAGGAARGLLDLRVELAGSLQQLAGTIHVDGTGASVLYRQPYVTRLADPMLEIDVRDGVATLRSGSAVLNDGPVSLAGEVSVAGGADLRAAFSEVRYRLDYGLSVELGGELRLQWPPDDVDGPPVPGRASRPLLSGEVLVERGLVRRDLDLEREVLAVLRGSADELGEVDDFARQLGLDLLVATASGVRVRNNVADLRVRWSPIEVRGTLAEPILDGTVEVDPGGTVFAYGQRARVDRGLLRLPGRPGAEPQVAFDVTTALEDPSLLALEDRSLDPFAGGDPAAEGPGAQDVLLAGFADYFGSRVAAGLGRGLGESIRISLRPIDLLNESDPDARLTVGRDLNRYLTLGLSINLRQAEQRTYLLDLREVPRAPRLLGQVFTKEDGTEGVTLQQTLEAGGSRSDEVPRLRRLRIDAPEEVNEASLRRAIALRRGEPVYDGALFDVEVEASDALVRQGFSDPQVVATTRSARGARWVDVLVAVEPGPRAQVAFTGDPPPARSRVAIATLYRSDYYEPAALEEMARAAEAALRGAGFLDPTASARVAPVVSSGDTRQVTVASSGGRRVGLDRLVWEGASEEASERLDARFAGMRSRVELASALPEAEAAVRRELRALGHVEPIVRARSLSADGEELVVVVDPGPLLVVSEVAVRGAPLDLPPPSLEPGSVARGDRLAGAAFELEDALRASGYLDARVGVEVVPLAEGNSAAVTFDVAPGEPYRLGEIEVAGLRATNPALVRRLIGSSPGDVLGDGELDQARRALFESGLFSGVVVQPRRGEDEDPARTRLGVEVEETPRFQLGYGLRYETEVGLGAVVDAVDRNVAGWGLQLGARLLYRSDDQRVRLWFSSPRLAGSRLVLEGFGQIAEEILDEGGAEETFIDSFDSGLQLWRPVGARSRVGVYARFREETFSFDDEFFGPIEVIVRSPILGAQYLYRGVQDPFQRASRGLWASVDVSGSDEAIGGELRFVRLFGQLGLVTTPFQLAGRTVDWAQLYRVGLAEAFDQELIRSERFFAGGAFSVRGYPREGIGPLESLGDCESPLGGEALFVMNQELRFPIFGDFGGVLFLDIGNVWGQVGDFGQDFEVGVGAGARWRSPVGLLRLDVAAPLDPREGEKKLRLYFGFGHVF